MTRNKSGREGLRRGGITPRRARVLGGVAAAAALVSVLASGCGSSSTPNVASPRDFLVLGSTLWQSGRETLTLGGCIPTADSSKGRGDKIGSNLYVNTQGEGNVGETVLGTGFRFSHNKSHFLILTGSVYVDTNDGVEKPNGTINAQALDNYFMTHGTVAESLYQAPAEYAGARCMLYTVSPRSVETLNGDGGVARQVPFPSPESDYLIGLGSMSLVNYNPADGVLKVLAEPTVAP
jgi:hypothetical protein